MTRRKNPVPMGSLIDRRGTWTLAPDALQRMANEVVATVVRLAADSHDTINIMVGHVKLGAIHATTRYEYEEVEAMIQEDRRGR